MLKPTLYTIAKSLDQSPYPLFTTPYSVNLGGIRNVQELQSNKFNDFLYAATNSKLLFMDAIFWYEIESNKCIIDLI